MAALRIFARTVLSTCRPYRGIVGDLWSYYPTSIIAVHKRCASFKTSPMYNKETKYTDFTVSTNSSDWMFVERCLKAKHIPAPPKNIEDSPSGWKPQKSDKKDHLPYFVERSKNHLHPVYLHRKHRGLRRLTVIRKIQGDIITLEADLRKYLEKLSGTPVGSQILEPSSVLKFRGDYVSSVKNWLTMKGL